MRPFDYERAASSEAAVSAVSARGGHGAYLAGGTLLLDLMKLGTMRPEALIDINDLVREHGGIEVAPDELRLGALVRMAEAARHPEVARQYPVIAQSLLLAASPQLRNMATLAGNVLQRTRCNYFRDPTHRSCNKRVPGSGCAAREGIQRKHAVLGASAHCIASYPGDFAQALIALDAQVDIVGATGRRTLAVEALHRLPGDSPHLETVLAPGDLIVGFRIPARPWTRRSLYVKVRDRESYEFALASAAVALDLQEGVVRTARIALGGLATKPWRAHEAEAQLVGHAITEERARAAAEVALAAAETHGQDAFKPELGRRTVVRALLSAARLEV